MNRLLAQIKAHKIITALAVLIIITIAVISGGQNNTKSSSGQSAKNSSTQAQVTPPQFQIVSTHDTGAEATLTATIAPSVNNKTDMPTLCKYFSQQAASKPKEYYDASVYDDTTAPQLYQTVAVNGGGTTAQQNDYDQHYVMQYTYNPTTHFNSCAIYYGGVSDTSQEQDIKY